MKPRLPIRLLSPAMLTGMIGILSADGVAIFKEQPFHRDETARAVAYRTIIDSRGPWLRLVTHRGYVETHRSKMVAWIDLPGPLPDSLEDETDLAATRAALGELREFAARYPRAAPLFEEEIRWLELGIARFESGEIRFEGRWMTRSWRDELLRDRRALAGDAWRRQVEELIRDTKMAEQSLVKTGDQSVTREETARPSPAARTGLSDCLWPLLYPDLDGARLALNNLTTYATGQTGTEKVRAEALHKAIRNLFLAENRLARQLLAHSQSSATARRLGQNAREWLKPNAFGTNRETQAREAAAEAILLRDQAVSPLAECRDDLRAQLRDMDSRAADFLDQGEHRVALILAETVRHLAARRFPDGSVEFALSTESLTAIRAGIAGVTKAPRP